MAYVKIPKLFYTFEQLAEKWDCSSEDIKQLVECSLLKPTPRWAAANGKKGIWIVVFDNADQATFAELPDDIPDGCLVVTTYPYDGEDRSEARNRLWQQMKEAGDYDHVITSQEVSRYETEYGTHKTEESVHRISRRQSDHGRNGAIAKAGCFTERNEKIRSDHQRLQKDNVPEPIKVLCDLFHLSRSQIHRIIKET
jgi:hypothetical protein